MSRWLCAVIVAGVGCASSQAGSDAGSTAAGCAAATGAVCTPLTDDSTPVQETQIAEDPPVPTGGALQDGRYQIAGIYLYTGDGGAAGPLPWSETHTTQVSGDCLYSVGSKDGGAELTSAIQFTISGDTIDGEQTCPAGVNTPFVKSYSILSNGDLLEFRSATEVERLHPVP
jgi:hypothetical protein